MSTNQGRTARLFGEIIPIKYHIVIRPDLGSFTFSGKERITLNKVYDGSVISLHCNHLSVTSAAAVLEGKRLDSHDVQYDSEAETVSIYFRDNIPAGEMDLEIEFSGLLNDEMRGFYRSAYVHNGEERFIATTQFEATDARRAFPCVDEPAAKAVFDVEIIAQKGLSVISNTQELEVGEEEPGFSRFVFESTPKMSTYLLAFIVGDFEYIQRETSNGVMVRVFTTPGKKDQAVFSLDVAVRCLEFYEEYFDIPYPLPILDMIAIPDFAAGAMENWGAVTYREIALLVDEEVSSTAAKQWVALVICHELAHQWFGNLVTMEWWTDLWLNEGFANYIEYMAVDHLFPEWDIWTQFAARELGRALELDSLASTHPVEVEVINTHEIDEIFDAVSYAKGATVVRMLAEYLGDEHFRLGLSHYLKKYSYGNAKTRDLWESLEEVSGKPLVAMMQQWVSQPGHPLVSVSFNHDGLVEFEQSRFYISSIERVKNKDQSTWMVPIKIIGEGGFASSYLLEEKNSDFSVPNLSWLKINKGETAVYRTAYSGAMIESLKIPIINQELSAADRLGVVRDAFASAQSGIIRTSSALELSASFKGENDYSVWSQILTHLGDLYQLIYKDDRVEYDRFMTDLVSDMVGRLGWEKKKSDSHTQVMLRNMILQAAVKYGDRKVITEALAVFEKGNIPGDLRSVVYIAKSAAGGHGDFDYFINAYKGCDNAEERNRLGRALGNFNDTERVGELLEFILSDAVRKQDVGNMFVFVWMNPAVREMVWDFVKDNWGRLREHLGDNPKSLEDFVELSGIFQTTEKAREVKELFSAHPVLSKSRALTQSLESIYSREAWYKKDREEISSWLSNRRY